LYRELVNRQRERERIEEGTRGNCGVAGIKGAQNFCSSPGRCLSSCLIFPLPLHTIPIYLRNILQFYEVNESQAKFEANAARRPKTSGANRKANTDNYTIHTHTHTYTLRAKSAETEAATTQGVRRVEQKQKQRQQTAAATLSQVRKQRNTTKVKFLQQQHVQHTTNIHTHSHNKHTHVQLSTYVYSNAVSLALDVDFKVNTFQANGQSK